jgi:hypothetical protein
MTIVSDSNSWVRAVERAIKDPAFKEKLMSDPVATLREAGVAVPDGVKIRVFQNTEHEVNLVLPSTSVDGVVTDAALEAAVGGLRNQVCTGQASGCATQITTGRLV